jgi:hypothetical protein
LNATQRAYTSFHARSFSKETVTCAMV